MGREWLGISIIGMVIVSFALLAVGDIHAASTPLVMVDPKVVGAAPTESFSVNIMVVNVTNMYAWQINMTFNPAILEVLDLVEGPFLKQFRTTMMTEPAINDTAGWVFAADAFFNWDEAGANGSGVLAVASFRVKTAGTCSLHFSRETTLLTFDGSVPVDMAYEIRDGVFGYPRDLAITGLVASTSSVQAGEPVSLDATVQNNGVVDEVFGVIFYRNSTIIGTKNDVTLDSGASIPVTLVWNTAGVAAGNYVMKAEVTAVSGDSDTTNNAFEDGTVTIELVHDVAITKVVVSSSSVSSGGIVSINVTVLNKGSATQSFNVAVSYNNTVIETQEFPGLAPGDSGTLTFLWDTKDVAPGNYMLTAATSTISGETNTGDNVYSTVPLQVTSAAFVLPIEWLAAIAAVVIVVLAGGIFLFMRRRSKNT